MLFSNQTFISGAGTVLGGGGAMKDRAKHIQQSQNFVDMVGGANNGNGNGASGSGYF